jgi:HSP20 family protein
MRNLAHIHPAEAMALMRRSMAAPDSTNGGRVWRPALDVIENDDAFVIQATLPGLSVEEIAVSVENDVLTIKAEHAENTEESNETYLLRERGFGSYHRTICLPSSIDVDNTTADVQNGILTLMLPKREEVKPRQIEITGA